MCKKSQLICVCSRKLSEIPDPIPGPAAKVTSCKQMTEEGGENLPFCQGDLSLPTVSVMLHDYGGGVDVSTVTNPEKCTTACQTTPSVKEAGVQTGPIIMTEKNETGTQTEDYLLSTPLRYEHICENDDTVRVYTDLPNVDTFHSVFEEMSGAEDESGRNQTDLLTNS
ncbi:hypothetical protein BaRGS_00020171 [Batillaria attramentaria]|uniref:Uncharacterized protein n=1 Tax=Batillaria attramentaria TaxID=370345 RepID=A0ABD0KN76_9CAEN